MMNLLRTLIARHIAWFFAVGEQCELWEEVMDELVVGPTGEYAWHVTTSSHPGETLDEGVDTTKENARDGADKVEDANQR